MIRNSKGTKKIEPTAETKADTTDSTSEINHGDAKKSMILRMKK